MSLLISTRKRFDFGWDKDEYGGLMIFIGWLRLYIKKHEEEDDN